MRLAGGYLTLFLLLIGNSLAELVQAHELQPSSMELRQLTSERFEVIWRAPVYDRKPHPARLQLPDAWQTVGEPSIRQLPDAALHRFPPIILLSFFNDAGKVKDLATIYLLRIVMKVYTDVFN